MTKDFPRFGITPRELTPGTVVMVPVGLGSAAVNGGPCVVAWAVVQGPADGLDVTDPAAKHWLYVYSAPNVAPVLPQMYRADEILGIPALGLSMEGAPPRTVR